MFTLTYCGESFDATENGSPQDIPFEQSSAGAAAAFCSAFERCSEQTYKLYWGGEDCEQIVTQQLDNGTYTVIEESLNAGRATYHGDRAQACHNAVEALGCGALLSNYLDECEQAFAGTIAAGGECWGDVECIGDLICTVKTACPGTCSARGSSGAACMANLHCQDGLLCHLVTGTCTAPKNNGEPCGGADQAQCAPPLLCVGGDPKKGIAGTCQPPEEVLVGALGDDCDILNGPLCQYGLHCAVVNYVLPDTLVSECVNSASSGTACHPAIPDMCPTDEHCDVPTSSINGTCRSLPSAGAACVETYDKRCQPYHRCVDDVCRAFEKNGGNCTDSAVCYSGSCNNGSCGAYDLCAD